MSPFRGMFILVRVLKEIMQEDQAILLPEARSVVSMYFYRVWYASFTRRFIVENLVFCIGYVIGIIHTVFT